LDFLPYTQKYKFQFHLSKKEFIMKTSKRFLLTAVFAAITFTFFACSGDDSGPNSPSPVSSDSSGGGEEQKVFCKLTAGSCSQMSLSTCMELVNAGSAQIVANCTEPGNTSSSSIVIFGYCDYGPIQANGDGGCFPMTTDDDAANCTKYGQVVSSCPVTPSSSSTTSSNTQSSSSVLLSSSSVTPSSSSVVIFGYCDYGPIQANGDGGCFPMATDDDAANCAKYGQVVSSCTANPSSSSATLGNTQSSSSTTPTSGYFFDERDDEVYEYNKIGNQTWMTEDLRFSPTTGNKVCIFLGLITSSCTLSTGTLYDWAAAMGQASNTILYTGVPEKFRGICPEGWHLPSKAEWETLATYSGTYDFKSDFGPGMNGYYTGSSHVDYRSRAVWWATTQYNANYAYNVMMVQNNNDLSKFGDQNYDYAMLKTNYLSVRCVKD
jgi:hypothetical protein